jgi:hypothetical protein
MWTPLNLPAVTTRPTCLPIKTFFLLQVLHVDHLDSDGNDYTSDLSLDKTLVLDLLQVCVSVCVTVCFVCVTVCLCVCVFRHTPN